jgi:glycosyltransferase involved in cell wall biosynthesis
MDKQEQPLLSLCIPTYNRANELRQTLAHLVSLKAFSEGDEIEAVISDNASTDYTREVALSFVEKHPHKIRYHRNERNVEDKNFGIVLSKGRGVFLKLSNDTLLHTENGLRRTLDVIRRNQEKKPVLCFRCESKGKADSHFTDLDSFWHARSYFSTWIAEFGTWRSDFTSAEDFNRAAETHLTQVDFLLRLMSAKHDAVIVEDIFFKLVPRKRIGIGSVNAARVFGRDYLDLLMPYLGPDGISKTTFRREKRLVFRWLVLSSFLNTRPGFLFPKDSFVRHLFKYYKWNWYFWISVPFAWAARAVSTIRNALARCTTH